MAALKIQSLRLACLKNAHLRKVKSAFFGFAGLDLGLSGSAIGQQGRKRRKPPVWQVLLVKILVVFCYVHIAFCVMQQDFGWIFTHYIILFGGFAYFIYHHSFNFGFLAFMALVFRLIFIADLPGFTTDLYRFLWDGRLWLAGFNPYLHIPAEFLQGPNAAAIDEAGRLVSGMGSLNASHYTVYPPFKQFCFGLAALFGSQSVLAGTIVLRLIIIAADVGVWWIGTKLLRKLNLNPRNIYLYLLNPFIILEFTGNLHFEGVMIFFLLLAVYLLLSWRWVLSALVLALSVSVKLIPLLFIPLFFQKLGGKKFIGYSLITMAGTALLFMPFLSAELFRNFSSSLQLYFQNFEFNASVYYIIRSIGFEVTGYNIIHTVGKILPFITLAGVLLLAFLRQNRDPNTLLKSMLWAIGLYYLLSSVVHPWYIAVPLALSVFTPYRFVLVWSFTVVLSYAAYANAGNTENLWLIAVEYLAVVGYLVYEWWGRKSVPS